MLRRVFVASTVAAVVMNVAIASANGPEARHLPPASGVMRTGPETLPPAAFGDFCRRTPRECAGDAKEAGRQELTRQRWQELVEINDIVNQTVTAQSDLSVYGTLDYWTIAGKYGDCEDYALTKQLMLRQRGWPMSVLLITVVRDENGDGHAILTVRTSRGDFVLDNRQPRIVAWTATPYQYIKRQSSSDPRIWMALAPGLAQPRDSAISALPVSKR